jgi:hypothetical protein
VHSHLASLAARIWVERATSERNHSGSNLYSFNPLNCHFSTTCFFDYLLH